MKSDAAHELVLAFASPLRRNSKSLVIAKERREFPDHRFADCVCHGFSSFHAIHQISSVVPKKMSLHARFSIHRSEMDRVMSLSRQKLRLESARDEPDLRKLLAHVCTVEHVECWIRENPPSRPAPVPAQDLEVDDREAEASPSLRTVKTEASIFHHWPTSDLRPIITVVQEVGDDDDESNDDDDDDHDSSSSEESWNGSNASDTSEASTFGKYAGRGFRKTAAKLTECRFDGRRARILSVGLLIRGYGAPGYGR